MRGGLITIGLAMLVIVIALASSRRRGGAAAPHSPPLAMALAGLVVVGAIALFFLYARH
jgi:hypothetical protein